MGVGGVLLVEVGHIPLHPLTISQSSWYRSNLEHNLSLAVTHRQRVGAVYNLPPPPAAHNTEARECRREEGKQS